MFLFLSIMIISHGDGSLHPENFHQTETISHRLKHSLNPAVKANWVAAEWLTIIFSVIQRRFRKTPQSVSLHLFSLCCIRYKPGTQTEEEPDVDRCESGKLTISWCFNEQHDSLSPLVHLNICNSENLWAKSLFLHRNPTKNATTEIHTSDFRPETAASDGNKSYLLFQHRRGLSSVSNSAASKRKHHVFIHNSKAEYLAQHSLTEQIL